MKKVFICQPMFGKTDDEIKKERDEISLKLKVRGYEIIDSFIDEDIDNPIYLLGESIKLLSTADFIYLLPGWENGRGCRIEKLVADTYNIPILEEV